ncbi:MAG TPA: GNAT family N-acetyltransferase [Solirubrobacterales bacterium]|nr:GNAT family N-acetyltransferase [Solirubrobacterales bacterium]
MPSEAVIKGGRTRLVPVSEADLDLLCQWFGDPRVAEFWGGTPMRRDEVAAKYLGRRRPQVESFVIYVDAVPIGYIQYSATGKTSGEMDLVLAPESRGSGLGPEAASALARYLLEALGWTRITVDPDRTNDRGIRAWEKAGFRRVERRGMTLIMELRA